MRGSEKEINIAIKIKCQTYVLMIENSLLSIPWMGYIFRGAYLYFNILIRVLIESQSKNPGSVLIRYICQACPRRDEHVPHNARPAWWSLGETTLHVRCEKYVRLAVDTLGKCSGLKANLDILTDFQ